MIMMALLQMEPPPTFSSCHHNKIQNQLHTLASERHSATFASEGHSTTFALEGHSTTVSHQVPL